MSVIIFYKSVFFDIILTKKENFVLNCLANR